MFGHRCRVELERRGGGTDTACGVIWTDCGRILYPNGVLSRLLDCRILVHWYGNEIRLRRLATSTVRCYMGDQRDFDKLLAYLKRVPSISPVAIETGKFDDGNWWVKFSLDITHPLAWNVVQEFACILNHLSITERLPTVFMPTSPAPYLNGGPKDYLSWVIESKDPLFKPGTISDWLEGRLPRPVDDISQWAFADNT